MSTVARSPVFSGDDLTSRVILAVRDFANGADCEGIDIAGGMLSVLGRLDTDGHIRWIISAGDTGPYFDIVYDREADTCTISLLSMVTGICHTGFSRYTSPPCLGDRISLPYGDVKEE